MNNIPSLTPLRGIAALLIVVHHFNSYMPMELQQTIAGITLFSKKSYLAVDFFFVLSGFVMAHVYQSYFNGRISGMNYKNFIVARFARIYPLHIFILLLFLAMGVIEGLVLFIKGSLSDQSALYSFIFSGYNTFTSLIKNFFLIHSLTFDTTVYKGWNNVSWSISVEWHAYLVFPFLVLLLKKVRSWAAAVMYCGLIGGIYGITVLNGGDLDTGGYYGLLRCLLEFMSGMLVYQLYESGFCNKYFSTELLLITSLLAIMLLMHFGGDDTYVVPLFALLILASSICKGAVTAALNSKPFTLLGDISYSVYMTHILIMLVFIKLWRFITRERLFHSFDADYYAIGLLFCVVTVLACSMVTYKWVEIPMRGYVKKKIG